MTNTTSHRRDCTRCGHSSDWHRMDSEKNFDPTDPATPFRCLGEDLDGCASSCPDMVRAPDPAVSP